MKRICFLAVLAVLAIQLNAQTLRADIVVSKYVDYDSTSFTLSAAKDVRFVIVDFASLDANDAYLKLGATGEDGIGGGYLSWTGDAAADSTILNVATNTYKERTSSGTRRSYTRTYYWFENGIPSSFLKATFVWGSVTSGRVKIYY